MRGLVKVLYEIGENHLLLIAGIYHDTPIIKKGRFIPLPTALLARQRRSQKPERGIDLPSLY